MNIYGNSTKKGYTDSGFPRHRVSTFSSKQVALPDEEAIEFSTIDGDVVTFNAGTHAVSNGAGIFIGDYFVGITESFSSLQHAPIVRY